MEKLSVHPEKLQHMIALVEQEVREAGFGYSADFLSIAGQSLVKEASLNENALTTRETSLESTAILQ